MELFTIQQAEQVLLDRAKRIRELETISLWDAVGRILAEDITALRDQPPFPRSPLDGYAVRSEVIKGCDRDHPVFLKVIDEVTAGHVSEKQVCENTAVRIMTGAPIPDGADCVVRQEDTDYGDNIVAVYREVGHHMNYCFSGEDYKVGTRLLSEGTRLGAVEVGCYRGESM